jgi:hypothetical protein
MRFNDAVWEREREKNIMVDLASSRRKKGYL